MIGKILTRLFALFGMTLTCVACYGVPEAEYQPAWSANGRVVDPEGKAIKGIKVVLGDIKTYSGEDGRFYAMGETPYLKFEDVDGEANGGEFESHMIDLSGRDGEIGNVTLNRKE